MKSKSVLFLLPYPMQKAPSQRFRVELFLPELQKKGIPFAIQTFMDETTWQVLYHKGSAIQKGWGVIKGCLRRLKAVLFDVPRFDFVFIHREASPLGPPWVEFIVARLWRKKIIYDFDDAIWIPNTTKENRIAGWLKAFWKVPLICRWAYKVSVGNHYLAEYARQCNDNVVVMPTCVDVENQHNRLKNQTGDQITIGWTGSHSTLPYLVPIIDVLKRVNADFNTEVIIISNKRPDFPLPDMRYIRWREATEINDLLEVNIGLMPLEQDPWCEGKCGFKLIQYMALGIPAVASPIGVNKEIVEHGVNGFLCTTHEDWYQAISSLLHDEQARIRMGGNGREKIVRQYSIQAHAGTFLALFN